ncbi:MAG: hypothetical protein ACM3JQ_03075 [Candidatus Eiseniibacteriota bacterium]
MNKFSPSEIGKEVNSEVACFVYRVPKENLDKMMNLNREFTHIIREFGAKHLIFQLSNKESPMDGVDNISKTLLAGQSDEENEDKKRRKNGSNVSTCIRVNHTRN